MRIPYRPGRIQMQLSSYSCQRLNDYFSLGGKSDWNTKRGSVEWSGWGGPSLACQAGQSWSGTLTPWPLSQFYKGSTDADSRIGPGVGFPPCLSSCRPSNCLTGRPQFKGKGRSGSESSGCWAQRGDPHPKIQWEILGPVAKRKMH